MPPKSFFRSDALSAKEKKQIRRWVGDLASWMEKSEQGRQEAEAANNHSVAYDAQLIAFNAFAGRRDRARKIAQAVPSRRVDPQILPDGSQPEELKRTLAYHYSQYEHLTDILLMSQSLGLPASNALVEKAQAYLTQYIDDARPWPYQQISGMDRSRRRLCADLARTVGFLPEAEEGTHALFAETVTRHFDADPDETFSLVYYTPTTYDNAMAHACDQMAYAITLAEKALRSRDNAAARRFIPRTFNATDSSLVLVHPHDWRRASSEAPCGSSTATPTTLFGDATPSHGRGASRKPKTTPAPTTSASCSDAHSATAMPSPASSRCAT